MDCIISFPDNDRKPPFSVISCPLEGQNYAIVAQNLAKATQKVNQYEKDTQ